MVVVQLFTVMNGYLLHNNNNLLCFELIFSKLSQSTALLLRLPHSSCGDDNSARDKAKAKNQIIR